MAQFTIPTIFTAKDYFTAPVVRMQGALSRFATIGGVAGSKLQNSLQHTSTAAMELSSNMIMMGAAIVIPLALATKEAMNFEKQMTNVATLVDTTKESMVDMGDAVLAISTKVPVAISDLTESLYQIRSAGVDASHAMDVLEKSAKLSVAGLSSATDATKAITSAMVAFKNQGLSTSEIANSFFLTVKEGKTKMEAINESFGSNAAIVATAGIKLQEFNAATAALTNSGLTASEAQTALRGSVIALIKPTSEMTEVLEAMGFTGSDAGQKLIEKMGGLVPAMEAVKNSAGKLGDSVNKAFGRVQGLTSYTLLTGNLKGQYGENLKEQLAGVDAQTAAFQKQLGTTASQAMLAKNELTILGIRIGELLLPVLTLLVEVLSPIVDWIGKFIHKHKILSGIVIGSIAAFGTFALVVGALSFAVGTVTKAFWLWNIALKVVGFTQGLVAASTGSLTGELLLLPGAAKGAAAGFSIMNTTALGLLGTLGKIAIATVAIYGIWKLFEKKDEAKDAMAAIIPHLPTGVDKKKFIDQFQDALSPGHIPLMKRLTGSVKEYYPQETYDSLRKKYYEEPREKAKQQLDSLSNEPMLPETGKQAQTKNKDEVSMNEPKEPVVNLYVNVDKNGNVSMNNKGNSMNMPFVGTTNGRYGV